MFVRVKPQKTLKNGKNQIYGENERDREISEVLQDSIRSVLRKGDFYTRYNAGQFLIMLPGIKQENCSIVFDRINQEFCGRVKKSEYCVEYYVASVADICPDRSQEIPSFDNRKDMWDE